MNGGASREFRRFDHPLKTEASRWLDREIIGRPSSENRDGVVATLIDSIDSKRRLAAWVAVERELGRGADGGPRTGILRRLKQRHEYLCEHGERAERCERRSEARELPPVETEWPDRPDVEEAGDRAVFRGSNRWGSLRDRYPEHFDDELGNAESDAEASVATDGGESE